MRKPSAFFPCLSLLLTLPALSFSSAVAAPQPEEAWRLIAKHDSERISLDKARISRLPNGNTAAWSRLTLGFDIPDVHTGIRYNAIEALNSYNCKKREYTTLKRVYIDDKGQSVREEKVEKRRTVAILPGSFEEKLLPEVCKPRAVGQMKDVAEQIEQLMNPADDAKPSSPAKAMTVAENAPAAKPTPIPSGKPRLIDLPKIDPSKVDNPAPSNASPAKEEAAEAAAASPPEKSASKSAPPKAEKTTTASPKPAPEYHTGNVSRAEIERQLATFGPRRVQASKTRTASAASAASGVKKKGKTPDNEYEHIHWAYEGKGGPDNWAKLSPDYQLCASGQRQSPINIQGGIHVDLEPIKFHYGPASYSVLDTGHTIQVNVAPGQNIRVMEHTYHLIQFHFHKPSEERVNGRRYDMVVHLVHKDDEGHLAVVALLVEAGPDNPIIQSVWNNLPLEQGMVVSPSPLLDLSKLLPAKPDYWIYMGSLTTPPCTEDVLWMVMKQPIPASPDQISIFGRLYPHNARPTQPDHGRLIKESR